MDLNKAVVMLDKPKGPTSREVVEAVRLKMTAKKAGDTGTLDPNTTGVLIICLDEATKAMPLFAGLDKEYVTTMRLHKDADKKQITEALKKFTGKIMQMPPVKSAVARKERQREIYSIKILDFKNRDVRLQIKCQAGTYIRKLIHDIGQSIGCGAQMADLQRIAVDKIKISECVALDRLTEKNIISLETLLKKIGAKKIAIKDFALKDFKNGKEIKSPSIAFIGKDVETGDTVAVYCNEKIIGLGKAVHGFDELQTERLYLKHQHVYLKPDRVFN